MPSKSDFTGLIGLVVDAPQSYTMQVTFTAAADGLPPSFTAQTMYSIEWHELIAASSVQLPAQHGNGSDEWYFLFSGIPDPTWTSPINIGFYIIEMITVNENDTSNAITLYTDQEFLYKVNVNLVLVTKN
jgi:hypothetical protein